MGTFKPIEGHCQCGAVRYRVSEPADKVYHCHCSMCRRSHGTMFATYAVMPRKGFTILSGAENLSTFSSSATTHRKFCKTCGCQICIDVDTKPDLIWYTPGTADGHPGHAKDKESHIYVESMTEWYDIHAKLPEHIEATTSPRRA